MIWAIFPVAWGLGMWVLLSNIIKGHGYYPPSWWWTTLPFSIVGFMAGAPTRSPVAGVVVGSLAAIVVHLWASARISKRYLGAAEVSSYLGRQGTVTKPLTSLDHGRINMEGRVEIEAGRIVYAITIGKTGKVALPKGTRVRIVGTTPGNRAIVEPVENFTDGYLLH